MEQGSGVHNKNDSLTVAAIVIVGAIMAWAAGWAYIDKVFGFGLAATASAVWSGGGESTQAFTAVVIVGVLFAALAGWLTIRSMTSGREMERHVRGPQLDDHKSLIKGEKTGIDATGRGIMIGPLTISRRRETGHFIVIGLPGSGKTVLLNSMLKQVIKRRDRIILHDPKGDFVRWLNPEDCKMLAPWDGRGFRWNISEDLSESALAIEAAAAWIPDPKSGDPMFSEAARQVLAGLIIGLQKRGGWGFTDLSDLLSLDMMRICGAAIEGWPPAAGVINYDEEGSVSKTTASVITTMTAPLSWVHQVAAAERSATGKGFSLREYLLESGPGAQQKILVLKSDARYTEASKGIFSVALKIIANIVSSPEMPEINPHDPGLWFFLDEFPQIGKEAGRAIATIQEVGRSRGARVCVAAQDISQLYSIYGKDDGRKAVSVQGTSIYFRSADESAKELSDRSGRRIVQRWGASFAEKGGFNESYNQSEAPICMPEDFSGLQITATGPECITIIQAQPARFVVPFPVMPPNRYPQFVENPGFKHGLSLMGAPAPAADQEREATLEMDLPAAPEPSSILELYSPVVDTDENTR